MGRYPLRLGSGFGTGDFSRVLYLKFADRVEAAPVSELTFVCVNLLIRLWFGQRDAQISEFLSRCSMEAPWFYDKRFHWRTFQSRLVYLAVRAEIVRFTTRRAKMAWKTPKIVEVPVGMEINMYACAARK
jgi:coenzyme PQQ precursor peptide PqqA